MHSPVTPCLLPHRACASLPGLADVHRKEASPLVEQFLQPNAQYFGIHAFHKACFVQLWTFRLDRKKRRQIPSSAIQLIS